MSEGKTKLRILVLDDYKDRADDTAEKVQSGLSAVGMSFEIQCKSGEALSDWIADSVDAFQDLRRGKPIKLDNPLEGTDIVFIDYALDGLDVRGVIHTADTIVGYLRALSRNTYFVSLNRNEDVDFDLRFLIGDYDTKADAALNDTHLLDRASLWDENAKPEEFRPWYWPILTRAHHRRRIAIETILGALGEPVLQTLGFEPTDSSALSRHASGFLFSSVAKERDGKTLGAITFGELFKSTGRTLGHAHRELFFDAITTGEHHLKEKSETYHYDEASRNRIKDLVSQVVAHEIDVWMRRDVIGGQDVLVDIPHLIERYPFLLGEEVRNLDTWQELAGGSEKALTRLEEACPQPLWEALQKHLMKHWEIWSDRPVFWWKRVETDETLMGALYEFDWDQISSEMPRFCEDVSIFHTTGYQEFNLETETSHPRRAIKYVDQKNYVPASRLAS